MTNNQMQSAVIRFAGDSGDGMQLTGGQFTLTTALNQQELTTFPDFPSEIRAPQGTTYGVSTFQIHFGAGGIHTIGDELDVLVCMNPAALKTQLQDLKIGGMVIVDTGSFDKRNLEKAGYEVNPLEDDTLSPYRSLQIDITEQAVNTAINSGFDKAIGNRSRNLWALGLVYWLFGRDRTMTLDWLKQKFEKRNPDAYKANVEALNAGHLYGEVTDLQAEVMPIDTPQASMDAGLYRTATGYETLTWGIVAGTKLAELDMVLCSYPITPASTMLHSATKMPQFGVKTFQAEDEIAAACAAIGASWAGKLGVTTSSGPGIALKTEALGLAVAAELPLIVVNVQRGGPSTGLPTKTEQSDLFQAVWGRNGDTPMIVLAPKSPSEAFNIGIEAVRLATKYMSPVMILSDGFIANASEPFKIPDVADYKPFPVTFRSNPEGYQVFARNEDLARDWVKVGTKGLEHRLGGLERDAVTGIVSTDADNHQVMTDLRAAKVAKVADEYPETSFEQGEAEGDLLVLGWGSTWGPIHQAVRKAIDEGKKVSHLHLQHIWPLPSDLKEKISKFKTVLVPELNNGQLVKLIRSETLVDARPLTKVTGKPFTTTELKAAIDENLKG
ncbi:MAG: 2-oxoacid:acceptor oxidoreductase subunit alpha [Alphaproteobacteria bacterium]